MAIVRLEKWPETEAEYFKAIRHFESYSKMQRKSDLASLELLVDLHDLLVKRACESFNLLPPHETGRFDWFGTDSDRTPFSIWYEEWQQKETKT
jgi:hypothetical protein